MKLALPGLKRRYALLSAAVGAATIALALPLLAQGSDSHSGMGTVDAPMTHHGVHMSAETPTLPGQDAFGAIQEIVEILDADPKTDWSKVDLEALRQHLIDMNEVTLKAKAVPKPVADGLEIAVTGRGRTVGAIQRMVVAHAAEIGRTHRNGWNASTTPLPDGVLLTVTAADPKEVQHIRGLGFIGVMVSGPHHQQHHMAMARGQMAHSAGEESEQR
jgi:hypothetical protein